jgi:hypothetical protein
MAVIHFQDSDFAIENKHDCSFKISPLIDMLNGAYQQFGIFRKYLSVDEVIIKYSGHNSIRQFTHGKLEISGCTV